MKTAEDFWEAYEEALEKYRREGSVIIIGNYEDYDPNIFINMEREDKTQILIHNGLIYFTQCPTGPHETTCGLVGRAISQSLETAHPEIFIVPTGSKDVLVVNKLGCNPIFKKQPDTSLDLKKSATKMRSPFLVVETGFTNEPLNMLLVESAFFLNEFTDVQYCILVKVECADRAQVEIFVCERNTKPLSEDESNRRKILLEKCETSKKRKEKFKGFPKLVSGNIDEIEAIFGFKVAGHQILTQDSEFPAIFQLNMKKILENSDYSIENDEYITWAFTKEFFDVVIEACKAYQEEREREKEKRLRKKGKEKITEVPHEGPSRKYRKLQK